MSKIIIIGGSLAGLASAFAMAEQGHEVHILERDATPPPSTVEEAHEQRIRPTVPQAAHSHAFGSLGCNLLRERAPAVFQDLLDAGVPEIHLGAAMPPTLTDHSAEPEDDELLMLAARRSTFELSMRRVVLQHPSISFHQGITVRGLEITDHALPRVTGVRTQEGTTHRADMVIDASGRRSPAARWLAEAGITVESEEVESCDITYYTRFYQRRTDQVPGPLNRGFGAGGLWSHYTTVLFLGDNGTFSISIGVLPDDTPMKALRNESVFTAALRATPLLAPWVEEGVADPISGVHAMGGLDNSLKALGTTRQRPVLGLFHVGDSVCTTNPAYGRGASLAIAHAFRLADIIAAHPTINEQQANEAALATEKLLSPWYREAVQNDRGRARMWRATVSGAELPAPPDGVITFGTAAAAAATDPVVWRRLTRVMMSLEDPSSLYNDDDIILRVKKALESGPVTGFSAPGREEFLQKLSTAA